MAVFLVPFGIVQYMPNLFYGALLALFGIEITMDWLIHSYRKVQSPPHALSECVSGERKVAIASLEYLSILFCTVIRKVNDRI